MKTFFKILTLAALSPAGLFAVGLNAHAQTDRDRMALIDSLSNPMLADGSEVMCFENVRIDAGEMNEDSVPSEYVFRWKNEGLSPLSVTFVQTTCGCAAPSYNRLPVQPGKDGSLKITYHPKGHPGRFLRKVFVYTNLSSESPTAVLELSGRVIPSVLPTGDYPVAMGGLLLKRSIVSFSGDTRQTERIECLNAGDKMLEIKVDPKTLPPGVLVESLKIAPGEIADLILRFDPSKAAASTSGFIRRTESGSGKRPASAPVFLKGLNLPLTQCIITINFN